MRDPIDEAASMLLAAGSVMVTTGAGISKESGIPTFRDAPNALWENYSPEDLATRDAFAKNPELVWRWYEDRRKMIAEARPNPGHVAIARMEPMFDEFLLVTQNIDDLHRQAGSKELVELHGNIFRYKCFANDHPVEDFPDGDDIPPLCHCGSYLRPDIVWFGEALGEENMSRSYQAVESCDVMLVVGTSGIVYPAAGLPVEAKRAGAKIIEVNPDETPITGIADIFLGAPSGEILPAVVERLAGA